METILRQKRMAKAGLCLNVGILTLVSVLAVLCDDGQSRYWQTGPQQDLKIVSVRIDTWFRYYGLVILIVCLNIGRVIVDDVCNPTIFFPVYDPSVTEVQGWTKHELAFCANILQLTTGLRELFMLQISIAQIDISMINVISSWIATIYTVRLLIKHKTFKHHDSYEAVPQIIVQQ